MKRRDRAHRADAATARRAREATGAAGRAGWRRRIRRARLRWSRGGALVADLDARRSPADRASARRWKFDPAAWWRLRKHIARLQARPGANLDVHGQRLRPLRRRCRPACRTDRGQRALRRLVEATCASSAIDRYLASRTDAIVVNSRGVRNECLREQGIAADEAALDSQRRRAAAARRRQREANWLAELGLAGRRPADRRRGALWPQKRIKDLIWAADLLKVIRDDVHLLIDRRRTAAASGSSAIAGQCHIEDKVHFLGRRDDVPRLDAALRRASGWPAATRCPTSSWRRWPPACRSWPATFRAIASWSSTAKRVSGAGGRSGRPGPVCPQDSGRSRAGARGWAKPAGQRIAANSRVEAMVAAHAALYRELLG